SQATQSLRAVLHNSASPQRLSVCQPVPSSLQRCSSLPSQRIAPISHVGSWHCTPVACWHSSVDAHPSSTCQACRPGGQPSRRFPSHRVCCESQTGSLQRGASSLVQCASSPARHSAPVSHVSTSTHSRSSLQRLSCAPLHSSSPGTQGRQVIEWTLHSSA